MAQMDSAKTAALRIVQDFLNFIRPTSLLTFGYVDGDQLTKNSKKWPRVVYALDFIMRNIFGFPRVLAVKLGTKISKFPACKGYDYSMICWWIAFKNLETLETSPTENVSTSDIVGPEWPQYRYMQILTSTDADHDISDLPAEFADENGPFRPSEDEQSIDGSPPSRLSTIQEGSNEDGSNYLVGKLVKQTIDTLPSYLQECVDEDLWKELDVNAQ